MWDVVESQPRYQWSAGRAVWAARGEEIRDSEMFLGVGEEGLLKVFKHFLCILLTGVGNIHSGHPTPSCSFWQEKTADGFTLS